MSFNDRASVVIYIQSIFLTICFHPPHHFSHTLRNKTNNNNFVSSGGVTIETIDNRRAIKNIFRTPVDNTTEFRKRTQPDVFYVFVKSPKSVWLRRITHIDGRLSIPVGVWPSLPVTFYLSLPQSIFKRNNNRYYPTDKWCW